MWQYEILSHIPVSLFSKLFLFDFFFSSKRMFESACVYVRDAH